MQTGEVAKSLAKKSLAARRAHVSSLLDRTVAPNAAPAVAPNASRAHTPTPEGDARHEPEGEALKEHGWDPKEKDPAHFHPVPQERLAPVHGMD